ncbi:restriction endonuclease subunit M [Pseudomonas sp. FW300-N1A1]|uniref:class I SAM-dependent DNA methyltransferase n=1 Tax=Pseudomonas sp. FW300-N1A1 TaxID=2075555 RepID=UPI000CD0F968|nr:class I SAM-dependent DNA methyltransferase [Pseudomonas sp. FW300-N1A1]POA19508.1 restriction endonuclease subunit M [Pseudomonas sp. FW300-N1A1]
MTDITPLREALLAAVPTDGSTIGIQSLLERLRGQFSQLTEEELRTTRDGLLTEGVLAKARGRGEAVKRAQLPVSSAVSLAEQALSKARERIDSAQEAPPVSKVKKSKVQATTTMPDLEKTLWASADKMRANMDAGEYKHIVLGLIFLKYISDSFAGRRAELEGKFTDTTDEYYLGADTAGLLADELEDRDYYREVNVFWVPEVARWESIRAAAKQVDIGRRIDEALSAIEAENPKLKNMLDKRFARAELPDGKLGELVDLISTIGFGSDIGKARDLLGQVYEYFLGQFARAEGKNAGQFYTPASIVKTLVAVLNPHHGKVYDPCCGSGGMFVQSEKFIEAHGGKRGDASIYGQESNPTTWRLAAMNIAIHGFEGNLGKEPADSFVRNQHPDLRADFVLANPPFNISDWWHGSLEGDPRWVYGTPPQGNANYAWLQHMLYHLKPTGRAGIVLANGSMSSSQSGEGEIRRAMVEADVVEVMVALPGQLFLNTQIPACLWFLARQKAKRPGEVLFIDARKIGTRISRVQIEFLESDIELIAQTVANWRGEPLDVGGNIAEYADIPGFCRSVTLAEVAEHGHVLTPGRYVGIEAVEDDDEAFADKMQNLTALLGEQIAKGTELDQLIRQKLGGQGYEF